MPRRRQSRDLFVAMNGVRVGRLRSSAGGTLEFQYDPDWIASANAIPLSLTLPLSPDPYSGPGVLHFFDNLLPDNDAIRRRMQVALDADSADPFDLLAAAGGDCVGALQLYPSEDMPDVRSVTARRVSDAQIAEILRGYRERPLGMDPARDDFRISLAGAQEKTAFLRRGRSWYRPRGATPTTHIFKLPIGELGGIDLSRSVENEWLCLRLAAELGLDVPAASIERFDGVQALVVERFDRRWSADRSWIVRLPQEDLCQALGVPAARKYERDGGPGMRAILDLLLQSLHPQDDRRAFFRACVVYWILFAPDGHAKNFSIFLQPGGRCAFTPVYDVLSVYPMLAARQLTRRHALAMSVHGKSRHFAWEQIQARHWLSTARACRFPTSDAEEILHDCAERIGPAVEKLESELPADFPDDIASPILEGVLAMQKRLD